MPELISKTPSQHVAALIKGGSPVFPTESDNIRRVLVRIPAEHLALVDAMAEHGERSRNFILNQLLMVGAHSVLDELPPEDYEALMMRSLVLGGQIEEGV